MKNEISAGGIIIRKYGKSWLVLLMKDMNGSWTFPKGLMEKGEKPEITAERETKEEVGITGLQLIKKLGPIEYWYRQNGLIHKRVYYFLFKLKGTSKINVQKEEGISEAKWFNIAEAEKVIGYRKTNKKLLEKALRNLSLRAKRGNLIKNL